MKPVSGRQMCKILEARGWQLRRISGSHHIYGRPDIPLTANVPVHGNKDLKPGTQRDIMRVAGLGDEDL
jgi:predicted RNA binding protein YcfA (HicA-like mRNA interferase family)